MQAKLVPWSSVVGSSITLHQNPNGPVDAQLMLMNVRVDSSATLQAQHEAISNRIIKALKLLDHVEVFIENNDITAPETICQCDHVIENAYTFIEGVCDVVGYLENEDD